MNHIPAFVESIQSVDNLNIVTFHANKHLLKMMSLDLSAEIQMGTQVLLSCKPTNIAIAKNISGELSYSNQLEVTIHSINEGELLTVLALKCDEFILESIITRDSHKRMKLQKNDTVIALIKSSDLSIEKIL